MSNNPANIWAQEQIHFHGQRPDEEVMMLRNQHLVVLWRPFVWLVVSGLIPYLLLMLPDHRYSFILIAVYAVAVLFAVFYGWYGYQNSVSILTNQRILQVHQKGFFSRQINEAELTRIQDVSTEIKGISQTVFGYGNVTIRTASKDSLLILKHISDPYEVQQAIVRTLKGEKE